LIRAGHLKDEGILGKACRAAKQRKA